MSLDGRIVIVGSAHHGPLLPTKITPSLSKLKYQKVTSSHLLFGLSVLVCLSLTLYIHIYLAKV